MIFVERYNHSIVVDLLYLNDQLMMPGTNPLKSKEGFEALFQNETFGIVVVTQTGRIEMVNSFTEKLLGYEPGELIGQQVDVLVPEALRDRHKEHRQAYMHDYSIRAMGSGMELMARHKDGTTRPVEISLSHYNVDEKEIMVVAFIKDIGKRKKAEDELRHNEQLFRKFIENTPAAVAMFDKEMKYIIVSKRWMTDYWLGDRDIIGLNHYEVFPDLPQEFREYHKRGLAGEEFKNREDAYVRADGKVQWVRWEINPWHTATGEIGGIIFYSEVITDRKNAEEALRKSEERFRLFFEGIKDSFIVNEAVKDSNGNITDLRYVDMNRVGEQILGKPRAALIGHLRSEIFGELDAEILDIANRVILKKELVMQERYVPLNKRWYEITSFSPVAGQMATLGVDITEKKEKDEKLKDARKELERRFNHLKTLNEELRDFAFVSSHHLQEPLRKLQTFGTIIKKTQAKNMDAAGNDFLDKMLSEAALARERIHDFLLFTNLNIKRKMKIPVNLNDVVKNLLEEMQLNIEESHAKIEVLNELPAIHADPDMMRSLFQNLITNAIKFHQPNIAPHVKIFANGHMEDGGKTEIRIQDNGLGIDNKYVTQIFKLFKKIHNGSSGTGIGLAVSRKICTLHHGNIEVKSKPGRGSTFIVTLPVLADDN